MVNRGNICANPMDIAGNFVYRGPLPHVKELRLLLEHKFSELETSTGQSEYSAPQGEQNFPPVSNNGTIFFLEFLRHHFIFLDVHLGEF